MEEKKGLATKRLKKGKKLIYKSKCRAGRFPKKLCKIVSAG